MMRCRFDGAAPVSGGGASANARSGSMRPFDLEAAKAGAKVVTRDDSCVSTPQTARKAYGT